VSTIPLRPALSLRCFALFVSLFVPLFAFAQGKPAAAPNRTPFSTYDPESAKPSSLHDTMRKRWEEHVIWLRNYIVSAAADLPDKDLVAERLMRNQEDIGNAIKPFYDVAVGSKLTVLLKDHIRISTEIVGAAKAGDIAKQGETSARWNKNADDIAAFLSETNPKNWPREEMQRLMHDHLRLTTDEIVARMGGHYADDIAAHDKVHRQILQVADKLSAGIMNQFPDKTAERQ
jgi:hypothetical protein